MAFIQKSSESKKSENESNKTKQINKALSFFFFFFSLLSALWQVLVGIKNCCYAAIRIIIVVHHKDST